MCYEGITYIKDTFPSLHGARLFSSSHTICYLGDGRASGWLRPRAQFRHNVFCQNSHKEGIDDLTRTILVELWLKKSEIDQSCFVAEEYRPAFMENLKMWISYPLCLEGQVQLVQSVESPLSCCCCVFLSQELSNTSLEIWLNCLGINSLKNTLVLTIFICSISLSNVYISYSSDFV